MSSRQRSARISAPRFAPASRGDKSTPRQSGVLRRAFATLKGSPVELAVPLQEETKKEASDATWKDWHYDGESRVKALGWDRALNNSAERSLCVWYSPWQHQSAENPLIPLLLEIRAQFSTWAKAREKLDKLNRRGGLAGLALLERVVDAAASLALARPVRFAEGMSDSVRKAWREASPAEPELGDGQRFHLLFEDAIETVLEGMEPGPAQRGEGAAILFIDDLDRCEEATVVQLLESLKLYLGSRRCVFILALDDSAVLSALTRQWPGRSEDANREYLEKLFQAIVPVPVPRRGKVQEFVEKQLGTHGFVDCPKCASLVSIWSSRIRARSRISSMAPARGGRSSRVRAPARTRRRAASPKCSFCSNSSVCSTSPSGVSSSASRGCSASSGTF